MIGRKCKYRSDNAVKGCVWREGRWLGWAQPSKSDNERGTYSAFIENVASGEVEAVALAHFTFVEALKHST
jgi:hypothetical protein